MKASKAALCRVAVVFSASTLALSGGGGGADEADAATLTWDSDAATTAAVVDGAGQWNGAGNWFDGTNNVNWANASDAVFGGASGTPGTVTVSGSAVSPNTVTFNVGGYTIADTTTAIRLNLGAGGVVANESATVRTMRGAQMAAPTQTWTVAPGKTFTIDATAATGTQFLVGGNTNLGRMLTIGGGGTVSFLATSDTFGLSTPMNSTLTINNATVNISGRTSGTLQDGISLVVRSRSDFAGPAGKVFVNTGGTIDLGLNYAAIQQNATGTPTFSATGPAGELHLDGGTITLAGFGNPAATTPLGSQGLVYLNGGEIKATKDNVNFIPAPWVSGVGGLGPQQMLVGVNGANIDSNGFNVTSANPLLADPASPGGGFTKKGAGTLTMTAANTYTGPTSVTGGKLVLGKSLTSSSSVSVGNDAVIELASDGSYNKVIKTGEIGIASNASIDLRDNKLLTSTPAGTFDGSTYTGVQGQVQRAYNFGAWDQPGVKTSEPNAGQNAGPLSGTTTIGVATGEQIIFIGPTETGVFAGQTITGATTIAMYTYAGDVNFDGVVDGADYGTLDNWIQFPGTDGYANGDVNYDGVIDGADYGVLDNTIQLQGAPIPGWDSTGAGSSVSLSGVTAVPEPTACGLALLGAATLLARRRRRRRRASEC